jgi:hypothetical protein
VFVAVIFPVIAQLFFLKVDWKNVGISIDFFAVKYGVLTGFFRCFNGAKNRFH